MKGHIEREGRRDNAMGLTKGARFHHAIFVVSEGATDFYGEDYRARAAAEQYARGLTKGDGKLRVVRNIGIGESYMTVDPVTNQQLLKFHGVGDGYGHA